MSRFSATKPQPLNRTDDSVRADATEMSDPFFPPKESLGKSTKPVKKASALVRGLAALGVYTNRPKTGELQLAKLVNRLDDELKAKPFGLLSLGTRQEDALGPAKIRMGDKEYTMTREIRNRFSLKGSSPFVDFMRYTLTSADGRATLMYEYLKERPSEQRLVYKNKNQGMKLSSMDNKVMGAARTMLERLSEKIQSQATALIDKSKQMELIEDLEL